MPDSFWIVDICGIVHYVDESTRDAIYNFMYTRKRNSGFDIFEFSTLNDSRVVMTADSFNSMWETSAEIRKSIDDYARAFKAEELF